MALTARQNFLLRKLVEAHRELDHPIGSKWIAEQDDVPWGPSTVRAELASLEEVGLLEHPHTSAGRVPTDRGYRVYVDELMTGGSLPVPRRSEALQPPSGPREGCDEFHDREAASSRRPLRSI